MKTLSNEVGSNILNAVAEGNLELAKKLQEDSESKHFIFDVSEMTDKGIDFATMFKVTQNID